MRRYGLVIVALALLAAGCAGENPLTDTAGRSGVAGFWSGFWHGLICPIAFAISLFNSQVSIYEVHNNGGWYDAGFIIGAGAWGALRGRTPKRKISDFGDDDVRAEASRRQLI